MSFVKLFLAILIILFPIINDADLEWCSTGFEMKHCAQNLDNPTWADGDPYCGFHPHYAVPGPQAFPSDTLKFWNVMDNGLFDLGTANSNWDVRWCGMCLEVTRFAGPASAPKLSSLIVKLVDHPTSYDMEMQIDTYDSLGLDMDWDTDNVTVVPIPCPIDNALTLPYFHYELGGINHYYLEIVVWYHVVPIESAFVKSQTASWTYTANNGWFALTRSMYNEFESNSLPEFHAPFELKIISVFGEEVIETFAEWPVADTFVSGAVQFSNTGCMVASPTAAPVPSTSPSQYPTTSPSVPQPTTSPIVPISTTPHVTVSGDWCDIYSDQRCISGNIISSDPYCAYNPNYAVGTNAVKLWNAISKSLFNANSFDVRWCGMCLNVTSYGQSVVVKVTDTTSSDIELHNEYFTGIGSPNYVNVTPVACPIDDVLTRTYLGYEVGGIDHYFIEFCIWDHVVPIEFASVKGYGANWAYQANDGWFALDRSQWNEFGSSGLPELVEPFELKIVSVFGEAVIQRFETWPVSNTFVTGNVQFENIGCMYVDGTVQTTETPTRTTGTRTTGTPTTETTGMTGTTGTGMSGTTETQSTAPQTQSPTAAPQTQAPTTAAPLYNPSKSYLYEPMYLCSFFIWFACVLMSN